MNLTPLKYLLFIENITSVFRNYLCFKRRTRIIVLFWVFIEALNISLTAATNFAPDMKIYQNMNRHAYFYLSAGFSGYLLITSLYYRKRFYMLLLNFEEFYKSFDDGVYYKKMLRAQKVLTCRAVLICGLITVMFTYLRFPKTSGSMGWVIAIMSLYCNSMSDVRYIFQYFVLHCILFVVSQQLKVIKRSIDSELSTITETQDVEHVELSSVSVNYEKLSQWAKAYENINDSANLCNCIFSVQVMFIKNSKYSLELLKKFVPK